MLTSYASESCQQQMILSVRACHLIQLCYLTSAAVHKQQTMLCECQMPSARDTEKNLL